MFLFTRRWQAGTPDQRVLIGFTRCIIAKRKMVSRGLKNHQPGADGLRHSTIGRPRPNRAPSQKPHFCCFASQQDAFAALTTNQMKKMIDIAVKKIKLFFMLPLRNDQRTIPTEHSNNSRKKVNSSEL